MATGQKKKLKKDYRTEREIESKIIIKRQPALNDIYPLYWTTSKEGIFMCNILCAIFYVQYF